MRPRLPIVALAAASLLPASLAACLGPDEAPADPAPNVVVIMTDDQTAASLAVMPKTLELLGEAGTTFDRAFASYPLCCPSRATFLTGQYAHNHGVESNRPPTGGYGRLDHSNTLPVWLQEAGYTTTHIGKYLNGYGRTDAREVPPGWDHWQGLVDPSTYRMYRYTINDDGGLRRYGNGPSDYQTDVLADRAVAAVNDRSRGDRPFFLSVAPLAPHSEAGRPPRAAPRHEGDFADEPLPRPPSFDEADLSDKPTFLRERPPLGPRTEAGITAAYRDRLEALLAVDDLVGRVVEALDEAGELDRTFVVLTADNGFFHGEHRVPSGKFLVYEEAVRVPLVVRGPGVPAGHHAGQLVANVDLAPTLVDASGAHAGRVPDGQSLLPLADDPERGRDRSVLLETGGRGRPTYAAVRTPRHLYAEHSTGDVELYDLRRDPYQLRSLHDDPAAARVERGLRAELRRLRECRGEACR